MNFTFYFQDSIYVIATAGVGVPSNKAERYDVKENKWIQVPSMKQPRRNHTVVATEGHYHHLFKNSRLRH